MSGCAWNGKTAMVVEIEDLILERARSVLGPLLWSLIIDAVADENVGELFYGAATTKK